MGRLREDYNLVIWIAGLGEEQKIDLTPAPRESYRR